MDINNYFIRVHYLNHKYLLFVATPNDKKLIKSTFVSLIFTIKIPL
jgi:hypothetical protein